jgi:hypothetical protein
VERIFPGNIEMLEENASLPSNFLKAVTSELYSLNMKNFMQQEQFNFQGKIFIVTE